MAGGLEDFDMTERNREFEGKYGAMNDEELIEECNRLDGDTTIEEVNERFTYVEDLVHKKGLEVETSFTDRVNVFPKFPGQPDEKVFGVDEFLGFTPNATDGGYSSRLINELKEAKKDGKSDGWKYKGKKVIVTWGRGNKLKYSVDKKLSKFVSETKTIVHLTKLEHATGDIERRIVETDNALPAPEVTQSVVNNSMEEIDNILDERVEELANELKTIDIDEADVTEFTGMFQNLAGDSKINIEAME